MRIALLVSGTGSIGAAMIERGLPVVAVVTDRPCAALDVGTRAGIAGELVERTDWGTGFDREAYSRRLVEVLAAHHTELVVMAGFGTVLGQPFFDAYGGRVLNTHPALLPAFPGWHAVEAALAAGVRVTGCTVHLATLEVDSGPILAQEAVPVLESDTVESLHERIKTVERRLYPDTVAAVVADPAMLERAAPEPSKEPSE